MGVSFALNVNFFLTQNVTLYILFGYQFVSIGSLAIVFKLQRQLNSIFILLYSNIFLWIIQKMHWLKTFFINDVRVFQVIPPP